jgi:hypothetical protein
MTDTKYYLCNAYRDAIYDQYRTNVVKNNVNNFVLSQLSRDVYDNLEFECRLNVHRQLCEQLKFNLQSI